MEKRVFTKNVDGHDLIMCTKDGLVVAVEGDTIDASKWYHGEFGVFPSVNGWTPIEWEVLEESSEELYPVCYDLDEEDQKKKLESEDLKYVNLLDWETKEWWNSIGLPAPDGCKSEDEMKVRFAIFLKN
jgi:hypothetical protein